MSDLGFYVLFKRISVILGHGRVINERLCSVQLRNVDVLNPLTFKEASKIEADDTFIFFTFIFRRK